MTVVSFICQFFFQGYAFKKAVLAIYVCGNVTFLIMFLSNINHLWASKNLAVTDQVIIIIKAKKLEAALTAWIHIHEFQFGRPGHVPRGIMKCGLKRAIFNRVLWTITWCQTFMCNSESYGEGSTSWKRSDSVMSTLRFLRMLAFKKINKSHLENKGCH